MRSTGSCGRAGRRTLNVTGIELCGRHRRWHRAGTPNPWWRARCVGVAPWVQAESLHARDAERWSPRQTARVAVVGADYGRATSDSRRSPPGCSRRRLSTSTRGTRTRAPHREHHPPTWPRTSSHKCLRAEYRNDVALHSHTVGPLTVLPSFFPSLLLGG